MHQDNAFRVRRASSEERIKRLKKILHSLATRIPVIELKRVEELYPSLQNSMTVSMSNTKLNDSRQPDPKLKSQYFLCTKCKMTFTTQYSFDSHDCKFLKCVICKKTFKYQSYLNRHMSCHSRGRLYRCAKSKEKLYHSIKSKGRSYAHITSKERPYGCDKCTRVFRRMRDLEQHGKMAHDPNKQCKICGKVYSKKSNLMRHVSSHHARERNSIEEKSNFNALGTYAEINTETSKTRQLDQVCEDHLNEQIVTKDYGLQNEEQEHKVLENKFQQKEYEKEINQEKISEKMSEESSKVCDKRMEHEEIIKSSSEQEYAVTEDRFKHKEINQENMDSEKVFEENHRVCDEVMVQEEIVTGRFNFEQEHEALADRFQQEEPYEKENKVSEKNSEGGHRENVNDESTEQVEIKTSIQELVDKEIVRLINIVADS